MPYRQSTLVPVRSPHFYSKNGSASALLSLPSPLRELPVPARVQRQPSDKTAIVSAAQTLLSLMPSSTTSSTTTIVSTDNACQDVHDADNTLRHQGFLKENNVPLTDVSIPELADDICQSTSEQSTLQSDTTINQVDPLDESGFFGSTSLALPEDADFLSPMHCFMRQYCVEVFTNESKSNVETTAGTSRQTHRRRIPFGQVGIRCMFCKDEQDSSRSHCAVCFPSSLPNLYHSVETWQRRHSRVCDCIPAWVRRELNQLKSQSRSGAAGDVIFGPRRRSGLDWSRLHKVCGSRIHLES